MKFLAWPLCSAAAFLVIGTLPLSAALIHRYSFDGPANADASGATLVDSVGGANGVVRGIGAVFNSAGDALDLPGGPSTTAAYGDLPNHLVSSLTEVTLEGWITIDGGGNNWARIFDFGSTSPGGANGEVTGPGNTNGGGSEGLDYLFLSAARGANYNDQRVEVRAEDPAGGGIFTFDSNVPTTFGEQIHFAVTWKDTGAGTSEINYWRNGVQLTTGAAVDSNLSDLNDVNNWLGRSTWLNDGNLDGTFDEFRIYDTALDHAEVIASRAAGPDAGASDAPTINAFTASPSAIFEGDGTTLTWDITDPLGDLSVSITPQPGVIPGSPTVGNVMVSPGTATTYTLTATNGDGSRTAEVSVSVDPGVPVADDQALATAEQVPVAITLGASDPNGGTLGYVIVVPPAGGTLGGSAPNLTYTPNVGFTGGDSFTFRANDGKYESNIATVSITVNPAPVAPSDIILTSLEIPSTAVPGAYISDIVAVDSNPQDTHSFSLVSGAGDSDNALFSTSSNDLLAQSDFAAEVGNSFSIRLRATDSTGRSVEKAFVLTVVEAANDIVINEIHYDPEEPRSRSEFIELFNPGSSAVDLSAWFFEDGVAFSFPAGTSLGAGEYLVVAQDPPALLALYGVVALGPWSGRLDGDGEKVTLRDSAGQSVDVVDYKVGFPWPVASGGDGGSMELLNPSLDNDLGSSWRVSRPPGDLPEATLLPLASATWSWRPGDTEASVPISEWRQPAFNEDASWNPGVQAPIGYGTVNGVTLNTTITGMAGEYTSIFLRNTFTVQQGEIPAELLLRSTSDDGIVVWINGVEVARHRFSGEPTIAATAGNQPSEGNFDLATLSNPVSFLVEGENTIAVQLFNGSIGSSDLGFDMELIRPATTGQPSLPTPGVRNSVFTTDVPPNIRQVAHAPREAQSTDAVTITAKVTDPQGVASVALRFQIVAPGQFIPARTPRTVPQILADPEGEPPANPDFEDPGNWIRATMFDDGSNGDLLAGDSIYTATVPAQPHRTLVRYRIEVMDATGASARVPYPDDGALNFAYFVYDGVPDFVASARSVHPAGAGHVWPKETLTSVPVYHWLIRPQDMQTLQAYNGSEQFTNNGSATELAARRAYDWEGAMVYDGVVYDHIRARLRGGNSRYGDFDGRFPRGKRHYKFRFNRGSYFAAKDESGRPYERPWRIFNVSRMFGTKGGNSWGLPEEIGDKLYHTMGVPTQRAHWFHFRVIDGADEAPDQYNGDFWGIQQAQERYDVRFLESREMAKGNLYKLSDFFFDAESQRRYQSQDMVSDGSEFDNIRFNLHGGQSASWLNEYVNYDKWYGYSAVGEAIRHYDIFPEPSGRHRLKNLVWYFEPTGSDPSRGVCWELPYDYDASWGPNFNNGWDHANNGLYGHVTVGGQPYIDKPQMKIAHRNVLRSFRDLVWQEDQVGGLLDDRAAFISELSKADQDRWRSAPAGAGTANDDPLSFKVQDMKNFAFSGWSGGSGPNVGAGGRGAFLDSIADNPDSGQLPATPAISYTGAGGFPTDGLQFQSGAFSDPQGAGSFAAMEWRIGEIEDPGAPAWDPAEDFILENDLIWGSGELASFDATLAVPGNALRVGHTYRARVRHKDNTGRFSHWSAPVEFTTGLPLALGDLQSNLMITEIMYHPGDPSPAEVGAGFVESDFEYLELQNISTTLTLDLGDVRFTKGVDFDFDSGAITTLEPGEFVLVVHNLAAFEMRYGAGLPVAGAWDPSQSLSNGGEQVKLSHGAGTAIRDFVYDDAAPWPTAPDGSGPSLVLVDPASAPDHALAVSWRSSLAPAGTPGSAEANGPFAQWMASLGLDDPLGDPEEIGLSNLLVFALGADLLPEPSSASPTIIIVEQAGVQFAAIQFRRRIGAVDLDFVVELSSDLSNWDGATVPVSTEDNGDGTESVTVRASEAMGASEDQFLRLRVTVN